jgi:thiamine pyrophosphate-dependent acetolactate synthase large subunit-like protein
MEAPTRVWGVQGYASSELVERVTKESKRITLNDLQVPVTKHLSHLLKVALAARQGPVWLDLPKDVQNAVV